MNYESMTPSKYKYAITQIITVIISDIIKF